MGNNSLRGFGSSRQRLAARLRGNSATRARRVLAAGLFIGAGVLAVQPAVAGDLSVQAESETSLLVTTRDLPLGTTLHASDVKSVAVPESLRPAGALDNPASVDGRTLAGLARAGEPLTDARLLGPSTNPPGTVTVPVQLADAAIARLLRTGSAVDVVALGSGSQTANPVATDAKVLTVLSPPGKARDGPGDSEAEPLVLLAVPEEAAPELAAVSLAQPVTVTLR
ncbi:RcpC/CpaB family pilus assembly protein [Saccharomonospora sp. NPDC006951]